MEEEKKEVVITFNDAETGEHLADIVLSEEEYNVVIAAATFKDQSVEEYILSILKEEVENSDDESQDGSGKGIQSAPTDADE